MVGRTGGASPVSPAVATPLCPLVVHYWADLQSVYGFRCLTAYTKNTYCDVYTANAYSSERDMSASACTRFMAGYVSREA